VDTETTTPSPPRPPAFNKKRFAIYLAVGLLALVVFLIPIIDPEQILQIKNSLPTQENADRAIKTEYGTYLNYYLAQRRESLAKRPSKYSVDEALEKIKELDPAEFASAGDSNPYLEQAVAQNDLDLLKVLADKIHFEDGNYCVNAVIGGLKNGLKSIDSVRYLLNQVIGCREKGLFQLACQGDLNSFKTLFENGSPNLTILNPDGMGLADVAVKCGQEAMALELAKMGAPAPQPIQGPTSPPAPPSQLIDNNN
jgi:hypothetical protein